MSFMCKIEVGPKREECKKGGWCTGCQKFFEVGPRREKCEKGGGCEKGGCEAVSHLGAKKIFAPAPTFVKSCVRPWIQGPGERGHSPPEPFQGGTFPSSGSGGL